MYKMTYLIYDTLKKIENLKVYTKETEHSSSVWLKVSVGNDHSYTIYFISNDDNNNVAVRIFGLVSVDKSRWISILPVLNHLNEKYRYAKFTLDGDGDINLEYDYSISCPDPAASAFEIVTRITRIVNESYPTILRALGA